MTLSINLIYRWPLLGCRFWPESRAYCETSPLKLSMMFSQDMLGKILNVRARAHPVNVYLIDFLLSLNLKPSHQCLCQNTTYYTLLYYSLFYTKTDKSSKSIAYLLYVCEKGLFYRRTPAPQNEPSSCPLAECYYRRRQGQIARMIHGRCFWNK